MQNSKFVGHSAEIIQKSKIKVVLRALLACVLCCYSTHFYLDIQPRFRILSVEGEGRVVILGSLLRVALSAMLLF